MLQQKCPKRNQFPRQVILRRSGRRAVDGGVGIAVVVAGAVPPLLFRSRSQRARWNP